MSWLIYVTPNNALDQHCPFLSYSFFSNTMEAVPANRLGDVHSMVLQVCVIGIDEGQFVSTFFI